jgi:hypothetical protein
VHSVYPSGTNSNERFRYGNVRRIPLPFQLQQQQQQCPQRRITGNYRSSVSCSGQQDIRDCGVSSSRRTRSRDSRNTPPPAYITPPPTPSSSSTNSNTDNITASPVSDATDEYFTSQSLSEMNSDADPLTGWCVQRMLSFSSEEDDDDHIVQVQSKACLVNENVHRNTDYVRPIGATTNLTACTTRSWYNWWSFIR